MKRLLLVLIFVGGAILGGCSSPRGRGGVPVPKAVAGPGAEKIDLAINRGFDFLLKTQNKDGTFGKPNRTKGLNIYAPGLDSFAGYRLGTTGLCLSGLIENFNGRVDIEASIHRAAKGLVLQLPKMRRPTVDVMYNLWGHAYGIQGLLRYRSFSSADRSLMKDVDRVIQHQIGMLDRYVTVNGGWGYYDFKLGYQKPGDGPESFTTATILIALKEAEDAGFKLNPKTVRVSIQAVQRQRMPDFSYFYSEPHIYSPQGLINRPPGSLGRSQVCNAALRAWGDEKVTDQRIRDWLNRLFARNGWLRIGLKRPRPHESWAAVAGYFYYYGHMYAGFCIEELPVAERPFFQRHLAKLMVELQEKDGSWWDFPLYNYHQQYGTGMALMTLARCREIDVAETK